MGPSSGGHAESGNLRSMSAFVGGGDNRGAVVRMGDTVHRPQSSASPFVHLLLEHLAHSGFDGAPRFLGIDDEDREMLAFVPGDVPLPPRPPADGWLWVEGSAVESVGTLLARYHNTVRSFLPPSDASWRGGPPPPFGGDLICHNDPTVGNVVFRAAQAVALLDFDYAGPGDPIWDLAIAAQHWVPLGDPVDFTDGDPSAIPDRLMRFLRAYGSPVDVGRLLDAVDAYLVRGRAGVAVRVEAGEPAFVEYWNAGLGDRLLRAREWLSANRHRLV
jgi:hypothetical protein